MMKSIPLRIGRAYSPEEGVLPARIKASVAMHVSATLGLSRKLPMPCPIVRDSSPWLQPPFSCCVRTSQANPRRTLSLEGCWDAACVSATDPTLFLCFKDAAQRNEHPDHENSWCYDKLSKAHIHSSCL